LQHSFAEAQPNAAHQTPPITTSAEAGNSGK
jgi:hypothetical protein